MFTTPKVYAVKSKQAAPKGNVWLVLCGWWLGLCLVKLGNPIILDRLVSPPTNLLEFLFQPWPLAWGSLVAVGLCLFAFRGFLDLPTKPFTLCTGALLIWYGLQWLSATSSIDPALTKTTLHHFSLCMFAFACGFLGIRKADSPIPPILWGIGIGYCWVLMVGFEQHFGGLEATRQMVYQQEGWENLPKDYLKKLQSDRIFSTLVYPNALAGAVLLLFPPIVFGFFISLYRYSFVPKWVILGLLTYASVAVLFWSGSKAGWLIGLISTSAALLRFSISSRFRTVLIVCFVFLGLLAFGVRHQTYFEKGAKSLGARMDYWGSAMKTAVHRPLLGSGPGTFSITYRAQKPPEAEMALLAHNDYLEQACDSGVPSMIAYLCLFPISLIRLYRYSCNDLRDYSIWLGLLGWSLHGFLEFGLYIPALSWIAFFFLGWLERNQLNSQRI